MRKDFNKNKKINENNKNPRRKDAITVVISAYSTQDQANSRRIMRTQSSTCSTI